MSRRPNRPISASRRTYSRRPNLEMLEVRELMTGFTVTTVADNGNNASPTPGSLRAEILAADSDPSVGADTISFAIPGSGVQTILPPTFLPAITRTLVIDGDTQPGFTTTNTPVVVIDGSNTSAGTSGLLFISSPGCVVRGLSIVGFTSNGGAGGAAMDIQASAGSETIEGDYLGILPDGSTAKGNYYGIVAFSSNNTIGGSTAATRNVISGNTTEGVFVLGSATGNVISGNYIGTNAAGNAQVGNTYGVELAASGNTVGGLASGSGNLISGNVGPTGQTGVGVLLAGPSQSNVVEGNRIGTNVSGLTALANVYGVYFGTPPTGSAGDNVALDTIGGTVVGAGNLISGNFIGITGNVSASLIAGNTIGLNVNGNAPLPNGDGIFLGADATTIGGTTALARNVISGNSTATGAVGTGVDLTGDSDVFLGNYIGLTTSGVGGAGIGNVVGLSLHVTDSTIGGTTQGAGNVISGNSSDAIQIDDNGGIGLFGNVIGLNAQGAPLANGGNGINITIAAPSTTPTSPLPLNDTIGGTVAGAGNTITGSALAGIVLNDNDTAGITGLGIRGNVISANGRLGIDLNGSGVPVQSTLFVAATGIISNKLEVVGVYFGAPLTSYAIDLFANGQDGSGYGQGPVYLGSTTVTTNVDGFALFSPTFTPPATPYTYYSATVTGPDGNTSGFAANYPTYANAPQADLTVVTQQSISTAIVGNSVTFTDTVINDGSSTASNVVLQDALPISFVNVVTTTSVGTSTVDNNNVVTAQLGSLASGQSATIKITFTPSQAGGFADAAGVSSTTFDPNYANNQSQQTLTVQPSGSGPLADLGITQTVSPGGTIKVGSNMTYVLTVTNYGPNISTNATVNEFLPAGVTLVSATPSQGTLPTINGTFISDNLGTIAINASATLTIVVTTTAAGSITNSANVSGNQYDGIAGNNSTKLTTTVSSVNPNIKFLLSQTTSASPGLLGQNQTFTLTATNLGPDPATNATVVDTLPTLGNYVSAVPTQGAAPVVVNGFLIENFGTIAAGASATLTLIVTPKGPGLLVNGAGIYSPDAPNVANVYSNNGYISIPSGPSVIGVVGHSSNSSLILSFDVPLNASTANNTTNYSLVAMGKTGSGPNKTVTILSALYNSTNNTVTLTPTTKLDPTQYYQLVVVGNTSGGITDIYGRKLTGTQYGTAGTNYTLTFFAGTLAQG